MSASPIATVRVIIQSDVLGLAGGILINPPAALIPSVDEELVNSGHIQPGDLIRYIEQNGFQGPALVNRLTDAELSAYCAKIFPNNRWACCRRMTQLNCYTVVIAFN